MFLGEKDYQQLFLIKNYVKKKFRVKIIPCKTVRDKNYVALSSRNKLLSKNELIISGKISTKLRLFKKKILMNGFCKKEFEIFKNYLTKNFLIKLEYLEIRDEKNLSNFNIKNKFRIFIAYYINKIRLIDNF